MRDPILFRIQSKLLPAPGSKVESPRLERRGDRSRKTFTMGHGFVAQDTKELA